MKRNEFIATTAARFAVAGYQSGFDWTDERSIAKAKGLASKLEADGVAPWLTPPALHDLIERAHLFATFCACESGDVQSRAKAWLADYDKAKVSP